MGEQDQRQEEQRVIDGLFGKLMQAEHQSGPRDPAAERQIAAAVERQPAAPYYMAQAILVQEQALESLGRRLEELEQQLANRPAGGGFLGGLFGAPSQTATVAPSLGDRSRASSGWSGNLGAGPAAGPFQRGGTGFLGSALQTAAAVAGGVMVANLVTGLFAHEESQAAEVPVDEEILVDEPDEPAIDEGDPGDFGGFDEF